MNHDTELDNAAIEGAARHIHGLLQSSQAGARLEAPQRLNTARDGWRIQRRVSQSRPAPVVGWKCALPRRDGWLAAALHQALPDGSRVRAPVGPAGEPRIEPEFAFELRTDLPPRGHPYSAGEVAGAIGHVRLAVEILGSRYADAGQASGAELMADGLWHQSLLLGPVIDARMDGPAFPLTLAIEQQPDSILAARHPDGDPRLPLYWLAEFLRKEGIGLAAGQVVITGSLTGAISVPFGRRLQLRYGDLGVLSLTVDPP